MECIVEVFVEYPARAPRFTVVARAGEGRGAEAAAALRNNLKSVELELNAHAAELTVQEGGGGGAAKAAAAAADGDNAEEHLLQHQLRRLQMCLDVLGGDVDATRMFGRARRGRDRRLAFVFDPTTKQFMHR